MFCQYCFSSEPIPLFDMQSMSFELNGLLISYLDCFKQCKQIKIEDERSAKICTSCIPVLTEEFTLKQLKNDQPNFEIASIKEEPELILDSWCIPDDETVTSAVKTETPASTYTKESEQHILKTEPTLTIDSKSYNTVFVITEIKEEPELIDVKVEPDFDSAANSEPVISIPPTKNEPKKHNRESQNETSVPSMSKIYRCNQCSTVFQSRHMLYYHTKSVHSLEKHECQHCSKTFTTKRNLDRHITVHSVSKDHQCKKCLAAFKNRNSLYSHFKNMHAPKQFQCHHCPSLCKTKRGLISHFLIHFEGKFKCSHCEKSYLSPGRLAMHVLSHSKAKKYQCTQCDAAFKLPTHLRTHTTLVHSLEKYECSQCSKIFNAQRKLTQHILSHSDSKNHSCSQCSKVFKFRSNLSSHLKTKH